jgi:multicomponent Na+:H+ antiporter subunit C
VKLAFALTAATIFGTGAYLLLHRDLVRVVLGIVLISQSAVLTLIASGLTRGAAPIYPLTSNKLSDPLSQAMALTAIVLVLRVVRAYESREIDEVAEEEAEHDAQLERRHAPEHEAEEAAAR